MHQDRGSQASAATDEALLRALGEQLAAFRLRADLSQADLAREAGVSRATVQRLEAGASTQVANLVRVLRALGLGPRVLQLVPEAHPSPLEAVRTSRRRARRRASGTARPRGASSDWSWADEPPGEDEVG